MIRIENVNIRAGDFRVEDARLEIPTGQYGVLMGRTGSGKTTILEAIAGLRELQTGQIWLGDRNVSQLSPAEREIGYVPQDGALFTTMTVRQHLAFALVIRRRSKAEIAGRVEELAELLGIAHLLKRRIHKLSGGERQRVALGRALSFSPSTLLLDEPLSALDDETLEQMYALLKQVQKQSGVTTLHVTHSREEARRLADCVYRFRSGRVHKMDLEELE